MEPTNNESERMLRKVVIHRKIRQKLVTVGGKIIIRHHNDVSAHVGQERAELVRKTVRSVLGDLTCYFQTPQRLKYNKKNQVVAQSKALSSLRAQTKVLADLSLYFSSLPFLDSYHTIPITHIY